ncbi:MAG: HNH endonuclease [Paraclostridium sordellii]
MKIMHTKKSIKNQEYEQYWQLTLEYSDIYSDKFNGCLGIIVKFIDDNKNENFTTEKYVKLQNTVNSVFPKSDMGSTRKSINQFVKLGFIDYNLKSYHKETKAFLRSSDKDKKRSLFSKIVYSNASFSRTVTEQSKNREINFLIKTLENVEKIDKDDLLGLMYTNISSIKKGYLTRDELNEKVRIVKELNFGDRKYNQQRYIWNIVKKLDDIIFNDTYISLDSTNLIDFEGKFTGKKRDNYLHRIYKNQLKDESIRYFGKIKCMLEEIACMAPIASHIKPFIVCDDFEAYDVNNGLLLGRDLDFLFDQGYITVTTSGNVLCSTKLDKEIAISINAKNLKLNKFFLNDSRKLYLEYHNNKVFKK